MIGCDGSFCATNYGECCGIHYKYSFATGYCQPGEDCGNRGAQNQLLIPRKIVTYAHFRNSRDLPERLIFVADRCAHLYVVVDPDAFYANTVSTEKIDETKKPEVKTR